MAWRSREGAGQNPGVSPRLRAQLDPGQKGASDWGPRGEARSEKAEQGKE